MSDDKRSSINQMAAMRITQKIGPEVLSVFLQLEEIMKSQGAASFTGNFGFIEAGDTVNPGEIIPSIHFSIQQHVPVLSVPIETEPQEDSPEEE
jgi:hypothetical protein